MPNRDSTTRPDANSLSSQVPRRSLHGQSLASACSSDRHISMRTLVLTLALLTGAVAVAVGAYAVTRLAELCI